MSLSQAQRVTPPEPSDPQLVNFSGVIENNLQTLFQSGHVHVGTNGVVSVVPSPTSGNVGDIIMGVIGGTPYLFFKTAPTTWFQIAGTAV